MKSTFSFLQIFLLICGVFGADADEVKTVMEGDSVTLNTDLTEIQGINQIQWKFGESGPVIAQIDGNGISYPYLTEIFGGRLQIDHQTGSLTIKNMRIKHSGLYKLIIDTNDGSSYMTFSVTIYESPSVIDAYKAEMKTVSGTEGNPVTLQTDVTETHGDELIVWRFGDEGKLIAKHDIEAKSSPLYDTDERFRGRLKLDEKTGSLNITDTRTTDSGVYTVKISSSKQTLYKKFNVIISEPGLSPGAVAGIVVVLLVCVAAAAAAAAAAGVIYNKCKIPKLQNKTWVTVMEGKSVKLKPVTEIQKDDQIQLVYGDEDALIAEIKGGTGQITNDDVPDWRFKDRLELDKTTGYLNITDTRTEDTGLYKILIRRGIKTLYEEFYISVEDMMISVAEGESVTVNPHTEMLKKADVICWMFGYKDGYTLIAEIKRETEEIFTYDNVLDGRFKGRLKLDKKTGSLTITNTRTTDSGKYELQINWGNILNKNFIVTVREKVEVIKLEGEDSVTLKPDVEIQKEDQVLWMFGYEDALIAQIRGGTGEITAYDVADGGFRGRLKLDKETGSLTITNTTTEHAGFYKLQIISSRGTSFKKFHFLMQIRYESVIEGKSITLHTGLTDTLTDGEILWMFRYENSPIARKTGNTVYVADGRFNNKLKLDEKTGSLIISDIRASEHAGHYQLKIRSSKVNMNSKFIVVVRARGKSVTEGKNEKRVTESATVEMPLLNREDHDGVNEQEGTSLL